jgi:2-C-methyl-D-erythritol 4-phosphate cytidylyltransferase
MIEWSIAAFRAAGAAALVAAVPPGSQDVPPGSQELPDDVRVVGGGGTRSESVSNALKAVETDLVAVHDAARPLVTPALIEEVVATLLADPDAAGAIAAAPLTDTIKQAADPTPGGRVASKPHQGVVDSPLAIERTIDRGRLWAAQTPQVFRVDALRRAIEADSGAAAATDEAMLVEAAGGRVLICPAPPENLKVTTPLDLRLAEALLGRA